MSIEFFHRAEEAFLEDESERMEAPSELPAVIFFFFFFNEMIIKINIVIS